MKDDFDDPKKAPVLVAASAEGHIENTPEHNNPPAWTTEALPDNGEPFEGADLPEDLDDAATDLGDLDGEPISELEQAERSAARFVAAMVRIAHATWQGFPLPEFQPPDMD